MQMLPPNGRKRRGTKGPLDEEESEGADLKLLKKKLRSWHPAPLVHGK